jgi:hypothetical protein
LSEVFVAKQEQLSRNARPRRTVGHTSNQKLVGAQESTDRMRLALCERRVGIVSGALELRADLVTVDDFDFSFVDELRDAIAYGVSGPASEAQIGARPGNKVDDQQPLACELERFFLIALRLDTRRNAKKSRRQDDIPNQTEHRRSPNDR